MSTQTGAEQGSFYFPPVEHWEDSAGHSATIARLEILEMKQFFRENNQSGFRRAVNYLAAQTGIELPDSEQAGLSPVIIISAADGVQFYDGRPRGSRKYYDLVQPVPGTYGVIRKGKLHGDTRVVLPRGCAAYFGVVSDRGATSALMDAERPAYEVFRRIAEATRTRRDRLFGRIASNS